MDQIGDGYDALNLEASSFASEWQPACFLAEANNVAIDCTMEVSEETALDENGDTATAADDLVSDISLPVESSDGLHEHLAKERPFACLVPGCGKSFARHDHLNTHMRTHTGERPFVCLVPGCGKSFARHDHLNVHMRTHTGERPFACLVPGCGKIFTRHDHLNTHMRTHTGERPFACLVPGCGKSFIQHSHLNAHMRTHTGKRSFVCPVSECGASFTQGHFLKKHMQSVHSAPIVPDEQE